MYQRAGPWTLALGIAVAMALTSGCSRKLLSVFFDVPPETRDRSATVQAAMPAPPPSSSTSDTVRPRIESTLNADTVKAMLPRDHAGNIDWMAALDKGVIEPRETLTGDVEKNAAQFLFGFDFYFQNAVPMFDAVFPHSSHTRWLACNQCHPRIFRYRGTKITMGDLAQGKYCGECHGRVAFPFTTGCERCHVDFPQLPNRAPADLIGTIKMKRIETAASDSTKVPVDSTGAVQDPLSEAFPEATFPHWVHRIRYKCKVCHMEVFEPAAGSNTVLMKDITRGEACGRCHNGRTAFDSGFTNCTRCHQSVEPSERNVRGG